MSTPNLHTPTYSLQQIGRRRAPASLWAELLTGMGFTVTKIDDSRSHVQHSEVTVAAIVGIESAEIELNADGITQVAPLLSPITSDKQAKLVPIFHQIDLDAIAIHEAGHAVAARELNRQFCYVRLSVTDNELAWCKDDGPDELDFVGDPDGVLAVQTVLAAGIAAEKLLFGWHREDGCTKDRIDIQVIENQKRDGEGPDADASILDYFVPIATEQLTPKKVLAIADALKANMNRYTFSVAVEPKEC